MDRKGMKPMAVSALSAALPMAMLNAGNARAGLPRNLVQGRPSEAVPGGLEYVIRPSQMPHVIDQLRLNGRDGSWATLMFSTGVRSAETNDQILNLQYSVEGGVVGLDWVLLGPRCIADLLQIGALAASRGLTVLVKRMNNVLYMRMEGADLAGLGQAIVKDLYRVPDAADMSLLISGWGCAAQATPKPMQASPEPCTTALVPDPHATRN